ncbi:acrB/AcrD/AcrF family protein, partial [Vibrio harveyi]
VVCHRLW